MLMALGQKTTACAERDCAQLPFGQRPCPTTAWGIAPGIGHQSSALANGHEQLSLIVYAIKSGHNASLK